MALRPALARLAVRAIPAPLLDRLRPGLRWRVNASTGYRAVAAPDGTLDTAWQDARIPTRQAAIVNRQMAALRACRPDRVFTALAEAVRITGAEHRPILEVGCAAGYNWEALESLLGHPVKYTGVDYSDAMLAEARRAYPGINVWRGDAARLRFATRSYPVVIAGGVLLHLREWQTAVRECARVSQQWVILHRMPMREGPTQSYSKRAYGVTCLEWVYGWGSLLPVLYGAGLVVAACYSLGEPEHGTGMWTLVCWKEKAAPIKA